LTVPTATTKPQVAKYGDEVFGGQLVLASFAVRRWKYNRLIQGQTVDAYIKETAYCQTQKGE